jgi:NADP-dependent 3-hydroxy acid dehydrogenase YdfG
VEEPLKVVITGASDGIGAALARHYAARGATLGLIARRDDLLRSLAASLAVTVATYPVDVRDGAALASAAADFIVALRAARRRDRQRGGQRRQPHRVSPTTSRPASGSST